MGRKTWILTKRGLITDPKHRERIGICVWTYFYILDRADWETGKVLRWKDKDEAETMDMPLPTLRWQRRKLQADGYIICERHGDHMTIEITKWVNPREYTGQVYNDRKRTPYMAGARKDESDKSLSLSEEGGAESYNESDNKSDKSPNDPSIRFTDSHITRTEDQEIGANPAMAARQRDWGAMMQTFEFEMSQHGIQSKSFRDYVKPTRLLTVDDGTATVLCQGEDVERQIEWLSDRLAKPIANHLMVKQVYFVAEKPMPESNVVPDQVLRSP